jgi:hypothetical protein
MLAAHFLGLLSKLDIAEKSNEFGVPVPGFDTTSVFSQGFGNK